jgi:hypothetical protein
LSLARPKDVVEEPLRELTESEQDIMPVHARRLRNDPGFIAAYKSAKERIVEEIFKSRPDEAELRESLYHEQRALDRLLNRMDSLGSARAARNAHRSIA